MATADRIAECRRLKKLVGREHESRSKYVYAQNWSQKNCLSDSANFSASGGSASYPINLTLPFGPLSIWPHLFHGAGHEKKEGRAFELVPGI